MAGQARHDRLSRQPPAKRSVSLRLAKRKRPRSQKETKSMNVKETIDCKVLIASLETCF